LDQEGKKIMTDTYGGKSLDELWAELTQDSWIDAGLAAATAPVEEKHDAVVVAALAPKSPNDFNCPHMVWGWCEACRRAIQMKEAGA
jgi:hypothetical protein